MRFLDALPLPRQRQFLADVEQLVRAQLSQLQKEAEQDRDQGLYRFLNARGAVLAMTARLEWLQEVRQALNGR
jgi:hypothetical protein